MTWKVSNVKQFEQFIRAVYAAEDSSRKPCNPCLRTTCLVFFPGFEVKKTRLYSSSAAALVIEVLSTAYLQSNLKRKHILKSRAKIEFSEGPIPNFPTVCGVFGNQLESFPCQRQCQRTTGYKLTIHSMTTGNSQKRIVNLQIRIPCIIVCDACEQLINILPRVQITLHLVSDVMQNIW